MTSLLAGNVAGDPDRPRAPRSSLCCSCERADRLRKMTCHD
jgi:hypothetical protein